MGGVGERRSVLWVLWGWVAVVMECVRGVLHSGRQAEVPHATANNAGSSEVEVCVGVGWGRGTWERGPDVRALGSPKGGGMCRWVHRCLARGGGACAASTALSTTSQPGRQHKP